MAPASRSSQEVWESFSQCFTPAVKEVVEFAKSIPGFQNLSQHDQVMLLKSGTFQVATDPEHFIIMTLDRTGGVRIMKHLDSI